MQKMKSATIVVTALVAGLASVSGAQAAAGGTGTGVPARVQGATPAPTDVSVPLPLQQFGFDDVAVDARHRHLYFTDGTQVLVTNFAGGVVASIPEAGASKMALAPDDDELYVETGTSKDTIVQIDTHALVARRSFTVDSTLQTRGIAVTDDRLWYIADVTSSCSVECTSGGVGSFDLHSRASTGTFTLNPDRYAPDAVGAAGGTLVVGYQKDGFGTADIDVYHPTHGTLAAAASTTLDLDFTLELVVAPDGRGVLIDGGELLSLRDLSVLEHYTGVTGLMFPAISAEGTVAFGYNDVVTDPEGDYTGTVGIRTYASTVGATPLRNIVFPLTDPSLDFLSDEAFSPDGRSLFAVTENLYKARGTTDAYSLHILSEPELAQSTITAIPKPSYALVGQPIVIHGTITSALPVRPGSILHVTRSVTQPSANGTPIPDVIVGQNGTFTIKDAPQAPNKEYWYTISYGGDCRHLSASGLSAIGVSYPTKLTLVSPKTDVVGTSIKITGAVTNGPFGQFSVYVTKIDPAHPKGVALRTIALPENGFFSFTDTPSVLGKTTYDVAFDGVDIIPSASATATVIVTK